jgi:hypothetical protein
MLLTLVEDMMAKLEEAEEIMNEMKFEIKELQECYVVETAQLQMKLTDRGRCTQ